ncbi:hypothetical protein pdam_00016296 [Pocillopora damicornis]|uniref:Uncharacterized protein n=1 Tax=Pocillopora damicornis TaxID=46731 RepID=A0A3M6U3U8_POCDA|nr:hypothetical protein pdam_00016296 [Pocillopora damicornis]
MDYSRSQKAEKAIFAVREVVHVLPINQTRGMASAGRKCAIDKSTVLGSPIITGKRVIGVVGEDADGQLIPYFITQTELDHKDKNLRGSGNSEDKDTKDSAEHQEKDPSEGGTGNVPDVPDGVPGEITENLKKLKHAMTESKYKSKGVPTLEITDELSKAVSDMGFITPILKSLMVPVI